MAIDAVAIRLHVDDRMASLKLNRIFDPERVPFHRPICGVEVDMIMGQRLHDLQTSKGSAVFGNEHLNGLQVVLVAAERLFARIAGVVAGMKQGIEQKPVGFRLHHRIVNVGREVARGLVFPVVVPGPIAVKVYGGDEILVRGDALSDDRRIVAGQILVRSRRARVSPGWRATDQRRHH